jgi:hypothetical protein
MVWLIRVLMIGTFSVAGERLFTQADRREIAGVMRRRPVRNQQLPMNPEPVLRRPSAATATFSPAPKPSEKARSGQYYGSASSEESGSPSGDRFENRQDRMF